MLIKGSVDDFNYNEKQIKTFSPTPFTLPMKAELISHGTRKRKTFFSIDERKKKKKDQILFPSQVEKLIMTKKVKSKIEENNKNKSLTIGGWCAMLTWPTIAPY